MKLELNLELQREPIKQKQTKICIGKCRLNVNSICVGCKRTIDEIKRAGNNNEHL